MCILISIIVYSKKKKEKKKGCLSQVGCVCLVFVVYNPSLQLQKLEPFGSCTLVIYIYIYIYKTEASADTTIFHVSTTQYLKNKK